MKTLKKSKNKVIDGVCGGFAEYLGIDPTIIRLILVILALGGVGTGILVYIICMLVMPGADTPDKADKETESSNKVEDDVSNLKSANINPDEEKETESGKRDDSDKHSNQEFESYFKDKK